MPTNTTCADLESALVSQIVEGDHDARAVIADLFEESGRDPSFWRQSHVMSANRIDEMPGELAALLPSVRDRWLAVGLSCGPCHEAAELRRLVASVYREGGLEPPALIVRLAGPLHGAIASHLLTQVRDQVRDQVGDQVRSQVWDQAYRCGYGSHDAHWLAFYAAFDLAGLPCARRLRPLAELSARVGWWWPFRGLAVVTDPPVELIMRGKKLVRLRYADGTEVSR